MEFQIKREEFLINGKPEIFLCGEIHYFRIEKEKWETVLDKLIEAGCNAVAYYVPWNLHEFEENQFDFTGKTFDNLDLLSWIELTKKKKLLGYIRIGPYIYAESTDLGVPKWFTLHYPDAHVKGYKDGKYVDTGEVNFASHNHPQFLHAVEQWYDAVCAVIKPNIFPNGNIAMLQLCNEIPGEDIDDRNPITLGIGKEDGLFPHFLKEKYGDVKALSEVYGETFREISLVEPHDLEKARPEVFVNDHLEFYYEYYYPQYFQTLKSFVEKHGIQIIFTHNAYNPRALSLHNTNIEKNPWLSLNVDCYYSLMGNLSMKSATYFCEYGAEYMKNFMHCIPWVAEHECGYWLDDPKVYGPELYIWNIWAVAAGYRGLNMFLFAGGKNRNGFGFYGTDHNWQAPVTENGECTERFFSIKKSIEDMQKDKNVLQASMRYDIGLGLKNQPGLIWKSIAKDGDATFYQLKTAGFTPKILDFEKLSLNELKKNPCLWIVSDEEMESEVQKKLLAYVQYGGKLVIGGRIPYKDKAGKECRLLEEALGVHVSACVQKTEDQQKVIWDEEYDLGHSVQPLMVKAQYVIARERKGAPCIAKIPYGKGQVMLLPFMQQTRFRSSARMVQKILECMEIFPEIKGAKEIRIMPKKDGVSVALNLHPVSVSEKIRIGRKEYDIFLEPYSYAIIREDG